MDNNQLFLKGLQSIRHVAALKNGRIEVSDVLGAFPGLELSDEQITLIHHYLEREGIALADYEPHDVNTLELRDWAEQAEDGQTSDREQVLFEMYQEELAQIPPISSQEEAELRNILLSSPEAEREKAARRLTEGNLRWVVQMARDYTGAGVPLADLIQEGNLSLWEQVRACADREDPAAFLEERIRASMEALVRESGSAVETQTQLAVMANRVLETIRRMEEELGREVTAAEISEKTGIPESRVEAVIRESAKAIQNVEHG